MLEYLSRAIQPHYISIWRFVPVFEDHIIWSRKGRRCPRSFARWHYHFAHFSRCLIIMLMKANDCRGNWAGKKDREKDIGRWNRCRYCYPSFCHDEDDLPGDSGPPGPLPIRSKFIIVVVEFVGFDWRIRTLPLSLPKSDLKASLGRNYSRST